MARNRHVVARRSQSQTIWLGFEPVSTTMTAVGGTIIFSLNASALALRPFTVLRTHYSFFVKSDQAAANENQVGALGMAVVSDEAFAAGVASVPTPITSIGSDLWFVHQLYWANAIDLTDNAKPGVQYVIDSKAMRRVDQGQDLLVISELSALGGGTILLNGGRMLVKVH